MKNNIWIGSALGLALCSAALACLFAKASNSIQPRRDRGRPASPDSHGAWNSETEKQLREAIASAPANGLKPDLFLKGGEKGAALTAGGAEICFRAGQRLCRPDEAARGLHDPAPERGRAPGTAAGDPEGRRQGTGSNSLAPQTDEYRALSQAHLHFLQLASEGAVPARSRRQADQARQPRSRAFRRSLRRCGGRLLDAPQRSSRPQRTAATQPHRSSTYSPPTRRCGEDSCRANSASSRTGSSAATRSTRSNAGPGYRARAARDRDGAAALAAAQPAGDADRRQHRGSVPRLLARRTACRPSQGRRGRGGQADAAAAGADLPAGRQADLDRARRASARRRSRTRARRGSQENKFVMKDGLYVQQSGPKNSLGLVKFDMRRQGSDLPSRHAGQGVVCACPTGIAATAASGSRMRVQFATALAEQEGVLDEFQQAMQKDDETFIKLPNEIPVRLLYQTAFWDGSRSPVPARRLRLGRQYREGAGPRAGRAAARSSSPKAATTSARNKLRAPDCSRRPHPPSHERIAAQQPRISGM